MVIPLKPKVKVPACEGEQCLPWDLIGVRCLIETVGFEPSKDILWGLGESEMELTPYSFTFCAVSKHMENSLRFERTVSTEVFS